MPINTRHPQYELMTGKWERVRDAVAGEDAIKGKGAKYLPLPPGIDHPWGADSPAFKNYLARATYPEIVAPTIQGMVGLMSRKEAQITIPETMEYLRQVATPDGIGLNGLLTRERHEVLATGRYVLFVDAPEDEGDPFIATYAAESLINWRADGERLTMLVFEEHLHEPDETDPFEHNEVTQWREASIEAQVDDESEFTGELRYIVRLWRKLTNAEGKDDFFVVSETQPRGRGVPIDRVPGVIVGSRDIVPDVDQVPLLNVVNRLLDAYRQLADYRLGLFMTSQPTPYGTGIGEDEAPSKVGPSAFWAAEDPGAKFGYAEVSGAGLGAQKEAIQDTKAEIMDAAMRVLGTGGKSAEAAEALRLRFQSQTATLTSISQSTAQGLETALRMIAEWIGADPEQVSVEPDTDFIRETPDAATLSAIADVVERGLMPEEVLAGYARRTDLSDLEDEDFRAMSPAAQALAPGDDG